MELKQLEYMTMAAELGSFNKASELLYTTQSNVSKVIRNLEKELGYPIFIRQGSGVVLTEEGQNLYDKALQILSMMKKVEASKIKKHSACFHVATVPSNYLAGCFTEIVEKNDGKDICFKMWDGEISHVIQLVEQGEADIGFLYINKSAVDSFQTLIHKKGLHFHPVVPAQIEICVGPKHPYYDRLLVDTEELQNLKYIRMFEDQISKTYHLNTLEQSLKLQHTLDDVLEVGSAYALMNILAKTDRTNLCYGNIQKPYQKGILEIRTIPVNVEEKVYLGYIHRWDMEPSDLSRQFIHILQDKQED